MNLLIFLGLLILALALVFAVFFKKSVIDRQIEKLNDLEDEVEKAKLKAKEIVEEAEKDAGSKAKEIELKAKEKAYQIKEEVEKEARNLKNEIAQKEARIVKKEEILDGKIEKAENKSLELEKINFRFNDEVIGTAEINRNINDSENFANGLIEAYEVFRQRSIKITEIDKYQDDALVTFTVSMRGRNNISDVVVSLSSIQNVEYVRDV